MSTIEGNRSRIVLAGSLLVAGGLVFLLFNTVAEGLYPNYSVASDSLSALGYIGANTSLLWNVQLFRNWFVAVLWYVYSVLQKSISIWRTQTKADWDPVLCSSCGNYNRVAIPRQLGARSAPRYRLIRGIHLLWCFCDQ